MKIDFTPRLQMTGAIAGIAIGVGGLVLGEVHKAKAAKEAKALQNSRPTLKPSPYTKDELSLTQSELAGGMGADAERFYKEQQDMSESDSIDAILKGGGSVNNVAQVFNGSQAGNQRLTMMKENLRLNQIHNFVDASRNAEQSRQQEFQFNSWAPWADESQANALQKQGSEQEINTGLNTAVSGLASEASSLKTKKDLQLTDQYGSPKGTKYGFGDGTMSGMSGNVDYSSLEGGGYTPNVAGSVGNPPNEASQLNYNFNNSANSDIWSTPGNS